MRERVLKYGSKKFKGFSLLELLISIAIFSIIVSGVFMLLRVADMNWSISSGFLDLQQQSRQAMDGMIKEIRHPIPLDVSVVDGGARINFLILMADKVTKNPGSYYLLNNQIIREYPVGTTKVLANNINNLSFCCLGGADCFDCASARSLRIQIQALKTVQNRALNFSLTERIRLRNE